MTDPKNSETTNEELSLEQLEDAAGAATSTEYGASAAMIAVALVGGDIACEIPCPKTNIAGSTSPGGDDV